MTVLVNLRSGHRRNIALGWPATNLHRRKWSILKLLGQFQGLVYARHHPPPWTLRGPLTSEDA